MSVTNLRCSLHPSRLLARMRLEGERPSYVQPENLVELWCRDCSLDYRREDPEVERVLHLFNFVGEFVRTEVLYDPPR
jgi:hypothetical protein